MPSKKFHFGKNLGQQKMLLDFHHKFNWMSSVHAEPTVNLTAFEHFCLTAVPLHLSFYYKYMHAKGRKV